MKKVTEKTPPRSRISVKGDISQCAIMDVTKSLIKNSKEATPTDEMDKQMRTAIEILNQAKGVEVIIPFWVSSMEVLENDKERTQLLYMPEAT